MPKRELSRQEFLRKTQFEIGKTTDEKRADLLRKRLKKYLEELGSFRMTSYMPKIRQKERIREFQKKAEDYRQRILKDKTITKEQKETALRKWEELIRLDYKVLRIEGLQKILQELGRKDSFQLKEAVKSRFKQKVLRSDKEPLEATEEFRKITVQDISKWGDYTYGPLAKYEAVVYFDPSAFELLYNYMDVKYKWGNIKEGYFLRKDPVLAVQVMHPDPKKLYTFTKAMLKKRGNNPVAVLDLYGNRFFP